MLGPRLQAAGQRFVFPHAMPIPASILERVETFGPLCFFTRHWLPDRLRREAPAVYQRLPVGYRTGEPLTAPRAPRTMIPLLSNDARLLASFTVA